MTDSRLERIIGQLADFDEQEFDIIVKKINKEREDRKKAKMRKLVEDFKKAWYDLRDAGIDICYYDYDKDIDCYLMDIDNFRFE